MGFVFSKIFSGLVGNDQMRIIIIGLDNAGKTTILCKSLLFVPSPSDPVTSTTDFEVNQNHFRFHHHLFCLHVFFELQTASISTKSNQLYQVS